MSKLGYTIKITFNTAWLEYPVVATITNVIYKDSAEFGGNSVKAVLAKCAAWTDSK